MNLLKLSNLQKKILVHCSEILFLVLFLIKKANSTRNAEYVFFLNIGIVLWKGEDGVYGVSVPRHCKSPAWLFSQISSPCCETGD